jgi:hypothetical protein
MSKPDGRKGHSGGARANAGRKKGPRRRQELTKDAADTLWEYADEWGLPAGELLSALILRTPRDLFHVAAECVREMGGAEKIAEPEEKPIII